MQWSRLRLVPCYVHMQLMGFGFHGILSQCIHFVSVLHFQVVLLIESASLASEEEARLSTQ